MFRLLVICVWLSLCFSCLFAQASVQVKKATPNLSGTWKLDDKQARNRAPTNRPTLLVIDHAGHEIKIVRKTDGPSQTESEFTYYTDRRGEQNDDVTISSVRISDYPVRSETKWQGKKLRTYATVRRNLSGRLLTWKLIAEWKLSDDAQMLTHTVRIVPENIDNSQMSGGRRPPSLPTVTVVARPVEFKYVFHRSS